MKILISLMESPLKREWGRCSTCLCIKSNPGTFPPPGRMRFYIFYNGQKCNFFTRSLKYLLPFHPPELKKSLPEKDVRFLYYFQHFMFPHLYENCLLYGRAKGKVDFLEEGRIVLFYLTDYIFIITREH